MEERAAVAVMLKTARDAAGLSQTALAHVSGVQQRQISKLESGVIDLAWLTWGTIRRLCDALALTPNELMDYHAPRTPAPTA
jgi:transcriptional regulator with XRE-family HTH domain